MLSSYTFTQKECQLTVTQLILIAMGLFVVVFAARVFLGRK
jgi:hypothetical protein